MDRRTFLQGAAALPLLGCGRAKCEPIAADLRPLIAPCFPSAAHQFVWRNWDLVPVERIAAALKCDIEIVRKLATAMGLGSIQVANRHESRTWFKVLRRNWDSVPFSQLTVLLDMPEKQIREMMIPFNFVNNHLGPERSCPPVRLDPTVPLSAEVMPYFGFSPDQGPAEERFGFLADLNRRTREPAWRKATGEVALSPRMLFPYSAMYGDVLGEAEFESCYSPGVLHNIARLGLDSIWLHAVLRDLVPSKHFPEFGGGGECRLRRLNQLIATAKQCGLGVYLFLNEPRGMPEPFFEKHPQVKGALGRPTDALTSLCTSTPEVKAFLVEACETLFRHASGLEGVILITASEAPTNCYAIHRRTPCPRCAKRSGPEVIGEVVQLIERGVHRAKPSAQIIVWDWSWTIVEDDPQEEIISHLPDNVTLMVDFERGMPIERNGVKAMVNEYCLSVVGPSPRAAAHVRQARARNMTVMAKIQVGNTWELGLLPYIPVPALVARKFQAMKAAGISGAMQSWTMGTYPSPNWEVAQAFYKTPAPEVDEILRQVAVGLYGQKAAPNVLEAWAVFADTFEQYPFSIQLVYSSFVQAGPAHPMYFEASGGTRRIMRDYDSLAWTRPFGPEAVADVFEQMAVAWQTGVRKLEAALNDVPPANKLEASRDFAISRAVFLYFKSISNQVRFLLYREQWRKKPELLDRMRDLVTEEIELAHELYAMAQTDSRVGFEPSMQYFYLPHDIRERIVTCRYMLAKQIPEAARKVGWRLGERSGNQ